MALIKLGSLAQDVRGSQNGLTFSRNKGGAYVRQKVSPVQPQTPAQREVRQRFSLNTKLWSGTMTAAQRAAWVAYAVTYPYSNVFGDSSVLTGLAMSVAKNQVLNQIHQASITDPPADNSVDAIPIPFGFAGDTVGDTLTIDTAAQAAPADTEYYVFMTPPLPPGRNPSESVYRFYGNFQTVAAQATVGTPADLYTDYISQFGQPVAGQITWAVIAQVSKTKGNITVGTKLNAVWT